MKQYHNQIIFYFTQVEAIISEIKAFRVENKT